MFNILDPITGAKPAAPIARYGYFDQMIFWRHYPLSDEHRALLERHSDPGFKIEHFPNGAWFYPWYRYRITIYRPRRQVLEWLKALLTHVEVAVDLVFDSVHARDQTYLYLHLFLVRLWRDKQYRRICFGRTNERGVPEYLDPAIDEPWDAIWWPDHTRYDAPDDAPSVLAMYPQDYCRVTGEMKPTLHFELRLQRSKVIRRAGIRDNLLRFDHHAFLAKRLRIAQIAAPADRIGRLVDNVACSTKRRTSITTWQRKPATSTSTRTVWNNDIVAGHALVNSVSTMQELLDQYGDDDQCGNYRLVDRGIVRSNPMDALLLPPPGMLGADAFEARSRPSTHYRCIPDHFPPLTLDPLPPPHHLH